MRQFPKLVLPAAAICLLGAAVSPRMALSAREKIERIEMEGLRPSEAITLTEDEINSLVRYEQRVDIPDGVRDVQFEIFQGRGTARAYVDLAKVQAARGEAPGYVLGWLLSGERFVKANCRFRSADGQGMVEVESVQIDDTEVSGPMLDWLIATYVVPRAPQFQPGEPFSLPHNLKEIRLEPGRAVAVSF